MLSLCDQINLFSISSICKIHQFGSTESNGKMLLTRFLKLVLVTATLVINIARYSRTVKIAPTSATQSSTGGGRIASNAIDGLLETITHTTQEPNPWLRIQLGNDFSVDKVVIYNKSPMARLSNILQSYQRNAFECNDNGKIAYITISLG